MRIRLNKRELLYFLSIFCLFHEVFLCSLSSFVFPKELVGLFFMGLWLCAFFLLSLKDRKTILNQDNFAVNFAVCIIMIFVLLGNSDLSYLLKYACIYIFFLISQNNKKWHNVFFKLLFISTIFFVLTTIWLYFDTNTYLKYFASNLYTSSNVNYAKYVSNGYTSGVCDHYSHLGIVLGNGFIFISSMIVCDFNQKKANKTSWLFLFWILIFISMIFCGKRAQLIFALAGIGLSGLLYTKAFIGKRLFKTLLFIIIIIVIFNVFLEYSPILQNYVSRFQNIDTDESVLERYSYWAIALEQFKSNPLTGIGWMTFRTLNIKNNDVHNMYLQILCETGIFGSIVFLVFFVISLLYSIRNVIIIRNFKTEIDKNTKITCLFSMAYQVNFLLYGLTGNPQNLYYSIMPYIVSCSMALFYYKRLKKYKNRLYMSIN